MANAKQGRKMVERKRNTAATMYHELVGDALRVKGDIQVRTHKKPHGDELVAFELIRRYATPKFLEKVTKDGYIYLGIGKGELDEHREDISQGKCCLTLTVDLLLKYSRALKNDLPELQHVIDYINCNDTNGGQQRNGIAEKYKAMTIIWGSDEDMQKNCDWFFQALEFKLCDVGNDDFSIERVIELSGEFEMEGFDITKWHARAEHAEKAWEDELFQRALKDLSFQMSKRRVSIEKVQKNGQVLRLVGVNSTELRISAAVRHKLKADVVVHRNPKTGHVHISTAKQTVKGNHYFLSEVIKILRLKEQFSQSDVTCRNWKRLASPYTIEEVPNWHYDTRSVSIFNGSLTHPHIEPSKQTFVEIMWAVRVGLDDNYYPPRFESECRKDTGTNCQACLMRKFGLWKCVKSIRAMNAPRKRRELQAKEASVVSI